MSVAIQNKFMADNGTPISGATVQALLTNGTTTTVQATDTTTSDGLWAFDAAVTGHQTSLPDPATGYWYDFKILYGSIVRWHYGGAKLFIRNINFGQGYTAVANTTWDFTAAGVLVKINSMGPVSTKSAAYVMVPADAQGLVVQGAAATVTLPAANSLPNGTRVSIKATIAGPTIVRAGTDTIWSLAASQTVVPGSGSMAAGDSYDLRTDGTSVWYVV